MRNRLFVTAFSVAILFNLGWFAVHNRYNSIDEGRMDSDLVHFSNNLFPLANAGRNSLSCQPITLPICRDMPWNLTKSPNLLNHSSQHEANRFFRKSTRLIDLFVSNCSAHVKELVCSFLTPFCDEGRIVRPCLSFYDTVSHYCSSMDEIISRDDLSNEQPCLQQQSGLFLSIIPGTSGQSAVQCAVAAPEHYRLQLVDGSELSSCGLPCDLATTDRWFSTDPKRARHVMFSLALACLLLCTFTFLTYLIDRGRFHYPERSIIHICTCFIPVSLCYLATTASLLFLDRSDSRSQPGGSPVLACDRQLLAQGLNTPCVTLFLLTYVPWLSSNVWFVILAITWFFTTVLKWGHEAIQRW